MSMLAIYLLFEETKQLSTVALVVCEMDPSVGQNKSDIEFQLLLKG